MTTFTFILLLRLFSSWSLCSVLSCLFSMSTSCRWFHVKSAFIVSGQTLNWTAVVRIRNVHPGSPDLNFYPSLIPDPTTAPNFLPFFVATNIKKLKIILFWRGKEKFFARTLWILVLYTQKFVIKLSKIWVYDPWSEGQKGTGSRVGNTAEPFLLSLFKQILYPLFDRRSVLLN